MTKTISSILLFLFLAGSNGNQEEEWNALEKLFKTSEMELTVSQFKLSEASEIFTIPSSETSRSLKISSPCECDGVLSSVFWHSFLPAYLKCSGGLVCVMKKVRWVTKEGRISIQGVQRTFRNANRKW